MPVNALVIRALMQYYTYYGDEFTVECPTGSGQQMNLYQVAEEIGRRLTNIFLKDKSGRRPVYGGTRQFQDDPHWRDCLLFYEYFHGDNGAGLGTAIKRVGQVPSLGLCICSPRSRRTSYLSRAKRSISSLQPEQRNSSPLVLAELCSLNWAR